MQGYRNLYVFWFVCFFSLHMHNSILVTKSFNYLIWFILSKKLTFIWFFFMWKIWANLTWLTTRLIRSVFNSFKMARFWPATRMTWPKPNLTQLFAIWACLSHAFTSFNWIQSIMDIIAYYKTMCVIWGINCNKIKVYFMDEYRTKEMKSKKSYMQSHWDVKS